MWECKHCNKIFDYIRATDRANHSRHCDQNPKRDETYINNKEVVKSRYDKTLGKYKNFDVVCSCCNTTFSVTEREFQHPMKEKYYCSKSCANSVGAKARTEKYGLTGYAAIAKRFYKEQCAVCGVTDVLDVHHIDEDRKNFHPSNLIFLCPNDHCRLHRNGDENVQKIIEGHGTAWGGHFTCNEEVSGIRIPDAPPDYFRQ